MLEEIVVNTTQFIAERVVEVKGYSKSNKAPREFTVHFSRRGDVNFGQWWIPDLGYLAPDAIPDAVRNAAISFMQQHNK